MVEEKMKKMIEVLNNLSNSPIEISKEEGTLILHDNQVTWSDAFEKRDAHSGNKIEFITPHKVAPGLYINFLQNLLVIDWVEDTADSKITLKCYELRKKFSTAKSWWML